MDPRMIPKNSASEYNTSDQGGEARPNDPGVYYHPQANKFNETTFVRRSDGTKVYDRASGKIQADAFVQLGYRPATDEEVAQYNKSKESKPEEASQTPSSASKTSTK